MPGTINWPDQRKRDNGRVPALARVLHASGRAYDWRTSPPRLLRSKTSRSSTRPPARPGRARAGTAPSSPPDIDLSADLPPWPTEEQLVALLENHPEIAAVWDQSSFLAAAG